MKKLLCFLCAICFISDMALAQSTVTLTINTRSPGRAIPSDFAGVSIFTETQKEGHRGMSGNLFSGTNSQLITLFTNSGIHHLRLGATGSLHADLPNLDSADIDSLFAFAKATDIRVIYSLHGLDGVATAKYVWDHYRPYVDCFALDNEPDGRVEGTPEKYDSYISDWLTFAKSVVNAAPGLMFTGPDASGRTLAPRFAKDVKSSGLLSFVTQHIYVGGNPIKHGLVSTQQGINSMLSREWVTNKYPALQRQVLFPIKQEGFLVRLTESDDYTHGVTNASDSFASALWALDYLHWWALHNARGVNFQNTEWLRTDTFHPDAAGDFQINPKAYGIRAFDLGSHGRVEPVSMDNSEDLNLTAYAVSSPTELCITIINKEHNAGARAASVIINPKGFSPGKAEVMFLIAPNIGATNGMTLGGSTITNKAPWQGQWAALNSLANGACKVTVPASSAAIVKMSSR
jgi:hypothetical protein